MTIALLLVFVVPFSLAIGAIVSNIDEIAVWAKTLGTSKLPELPKWVQSLPLVGRRVASAWRELNAAGPEELARMIAPYAQGAARWLLEQIGSFGVMTVLFLLTVVISAVMYAGGETAAAGLLRFARRLAGTHGEKAVHLAGQAIRGVAMGVVLVAIGQAVLGGIGLAVAGVPFPLLLTFLMFVLCLAQIGPGLILVGAIGWLYWIGSAGWATALLVWSIFVGTIDNVVRPILIMKSADLPLLLIFAGVIGGLLAFGLVGIFIGPVVLAVAYMLVDAWVSQEQAEGEPSTTGAGDHGES
jgi:predicted PurR-regulated permease PerM